MKNTILVAAATAVGLLMCESCQKSDNNGNTQLAVKMTDAPYNAQEVNIDIREVRINYSNKDTSEWTVLPTNTRVYNLLTLQNRRDTVVSSSSVPTGTVNQIRFILGPDNTIKINNVVYPLSISSGEESGLKINVGRALRAGSDSLLLDFDANMSIHQTGTGDYKLKPVINLK
jgi:hypothetical protein